MSPISINWSQSPPLLNTGTQNRPHGILHYSASDIRTCLVITVLYGAVIHGYRKAKDLLCMWPFQGPSAKRTMKLWENCSVPSSTYNGWLTGPVAAGKILTLELCSRAVLATCMRKHGSSAGWELMVENVEGQSKPKGPHKHRWWSRGMAKMECVIWPMYKH